MNLQISIERQGQIFVTGYIIGDLPSDACFQYAKSWLAFPGARPLSVGLPLQTDRFSPLQTRAFFEGLLPEGFSRFSIAQHLRLDESNYLLLLAALGSECLGAIKVTDEHIRPDTTAGYRLLSASDLHALAMEGASESTQLVAESRMSLTGASGKVGLYYDEERADWYQPIGDAPSTHILKQSHVRLHDIVLNEQLSLLTARSLGIDVPYSFIVDPDDGPETEVLFATKRYDRITSDASPLIDGIERPLRLHQEDFAQALGICAIDKYEKEGDAYLKDAFSLLRRFSSDPILDQLKLWDMILFDILIGNADHHLKNCSLLYSADLASVRLAPAYDLLSTAIYENNTRTMAFHIGNARRLEEIDRESIKRAAFDAGIGRDLALSRLDRMLHGFLPALMQAVAQLEKDGFSRAVSLAEQIKMAGGYERLLASNQTSS